MSRIHFAISEKFSNSFRPMKLDETKATEEGATKAAAVDSSSDSLDSGSSDSANAKVLIAESSSNAITQQKQRSFNLSSIFCSKDTDYIKAMMELIQRTTTIPRYGHHDTSPTSILKGNEDISNAAFARSISWLESKQKGRFLFQLEGTSTTAPVPTLAHGFVDLQPGWYCLSIVDSDNFCVIGSMPFVVVDPKRRESEYGVVPYQLSDRFADHRRSHPHQEDEAVVARQLQKEDVENQKKELEEPSLWHAKYVVYGIPVPVVVRSPSIQKLSSSPAARKARAQPATTRTKQEEKGGDVFGARSASRFDFIRHDQDLDLSFGVGSFWIVPGAAYLLASSQIAQSTTYMKKKRQAERDEHFARRNGEGLELPEHTLFGLYHGNYWLSRRRLVPFHNDDRRVAVAAAHEEFVNKTQLNFLHDATGAAAARHVGGKDKRKANASALTNASTPLSTSDFVPHDIFYYSADIEVPIGESSSGSSDKLTFRRVNATVGVVSHKYLQRVNSAEGLADALRKQHEQLVERNSSSPCVIQVGSSITFDRSLEIDGIECTIILGDNTVVTVAPHARVTLRGTANSPLLFTAVCGNAEAGCRWGGMIVRAGGELNLEHVMLSMVGSQSVPREPNTGTHIKKYAPAMTAAGGSTLSIRKSAVLNCAGPAFALGPQSIVTIAETLVQDVAQGGECVSCNITLRDSHILDIPYNNRNYAAFVDKDNDGFYFRGGHAVMERCVVGYALDDGIDSAASSGDVSKSSLNILQSVITSCQHEGIALSSSEGTMREVVIEDTVVSFCQQGVENGHTGDMHTATLHRLLLENNHIGLRHGDNYDLDVLGTVTARNSTFRWNDYNVLSYSIREHSGRRGKGRRRNDDNSAMIAGIHNPLVGHLGAAGGLDADRGDQRPTQALPRVFLDRCKLTSRQETSSDTNILTPGKLSAKKSGTMSVLQEDVGNLCGTQHYWPRGSV